MYHSKTLAAIGNLLTKSDVGTYTYPAPGAAQPHAVTAIAGGTINTTFTYDPNGNQLTGPARCQAEWGPVGRPDNAPL